MVGGDEGFRISLKFWQEVFWFLLHVGREKMVIFPSYILSGENFLLQLTNIEKFSTGIGISTQTLGGVNPDHCKWMENGNFYIW